MEVVRVAYPGQHMLLAWQGTFMAGDNVFVPTDQFAGGIRFFGASASTLQTQAKLDGVVSALSAFWARGDSFIPQRARIQTIKWNLIGADGRYVNKGTTLEKRDLDIAGTASMIHPLQVSWAATWMADVKRGLASRGRTYFPTGVEISSSQFLVSQANCQSMRASCAQLIRDLNTAVGGGQENTTVASIVSNMRDGASHPITQVGIGDRLDIQRRRADSQTETKYIQPVATPAS